MEELETYNLQSWANKHKTAQNTTDKDSKLT